MSPLPWLGEGSLWAAGLSASSADSEARPGGEAYRPEHAEPHPQERSQDPAWLGDGETQAKAEGSESDQVDVDLPGQIAAPTFTCRVARQLLRA